MKHIIYILSVFFFFAAFAPLLNAQTIEQISYMPVKTGNYQKLLVKRKTIIKGNLTATNLKSNATFLTLQTPNLTLTDPSRITAKKDIFLDGKYINIENANVYGSNIMLLTASNKLEITSLGSVKKLYSEDITASTMNITTHLYIDGIEYPINCTYTWKSVQTAKGGTYEVLACD